MDAKKLALLIGALLIAGVTAFMARSLFTGASTEQAEAAVPIGGKVLVAADSLPVGTIVEPVHFTYQPWPKELIQEAYYTEGQQAPAPGTVVRFPITKGQPITRGALVTPGDRGFLAAALGPGMRAVTVPVSAQSGVAGFVFPGDRVDLVLTQTVTGGGDGPPLKASETFIRNLRVLATDQRVDTSSEDKETGVRTFSTVTLEATPRIAEKIAVAQTIGQLSLSLRSIADNNAELERAIASGEVSVPDSKDPGAERNFLLAVASRPIDTDTSFVTGADVSRFQRRTVPGKPKRDGGDVTAAPAPAPARSGSIFDDTGPRGPIVRVARGKTVTVETVGGY